MSNLFTYVIELRDRMSGTLRRVGGSLVDTTSRVRRLRDQVRQLDRTPLTNLKNSFTNLFKNIPFSQYIFNPLTIAGVVGGRALKLGIDQEMRNASFEVLFGGVENARKMIDQIDAYSKKSSYGKEGLSAAAQQMAGFGIAQERIMPNMKAIGEIAMGDKGKFDSLTLAFSQMSAVGSLMGQDLNQMINAGFNPLLQMSKTTGKSIGALKDEMGKGKISASMVAQAFQDATNEGGQFYGMSEKMSQTLGGQMSTAMANVNDKLLSLYNIMQPYILPVISNFNLLLTDSGAFIDKLVGKFSNMSTTAKVVGGVLLWLGTTIVVYKVVMGAVTLATKAWGVAQAILNVILTLNPVGLIIAGIVALIALIAFLIIKIDGWGETWDNVMKFCGLVFDGFKTGLELKWLQIQDFFMSGLELIEKGWYKLQGLWNKDSANAGLAKLEAQRNERARELAEKQGKLEGLAKQMSEMEIIKLKVNDTSLGDVANSLKSKLGISAAGIPGMGGDGSFGGGGTDGTGGTGGGGASGAAANSIATGGSKTTHITVNVGEMGNRIVINSGNIREGAQQVRDIVLDELSRALSMAQANV